MRALDVFLRLRVDRERDILDSARPLGRRDDDFVPELDGVIRVGRGLGLGLGCSLRPGRCADAKRGDANQQIAQSTIPKHANFPCKAV